MHHQLVIVSGCLLAIIINNNHGLLSTAFCFGTLLNSGKFSHHLIGNNNHQLLLHAHQKPSPSPSSPDQQQPSPPTSIPKPVRTKKKKKNKYANFSKQSNDNSRDDPLDVMIKESRAKLEELHREEEEGRSSSRRRRKSSSDIQASLEAVNQLIQQNDVNDSYKEEMLEKEKNEMMVEKRTRNKRNFPDTKTIDPYDPTTYGYIELGTIIGAHGVHGMMKLSSITDFGTHRLCNPGIRHVKPPNKRAPREVQLVEGRPLQSTTTSTTGTDANPTYLIQLEHITDREEALKMRGCILYALEEETVDDLLEENEYIVSDLIGLNVYLDEEYTGSSQFEDMFVGNIKGVVMGSEMCAIPGLGQDLLEVVLPSRRGGEKGEDLVL